MNVKKYVELIRTFVDGELPASEFEREYLSVFKSDSGAMPDQLYDILQDLFTAVDCYWPECQPDQETVLLPPDLGRLLGFWANAGSDRKILTRIGKKGDTPVLSGAGRFTLS